MKRVAVILIVLCAALATPLLAQDKPADNRALVLEKVKADKKLLVGENMQLTEGEAKAFWPIYKEYRSEVEKLGDRVAKLVVAYAANIDTMTDAKAEAFFNEQMSIDRDRVALREKYVPRVRKVLPSMKAARFFQIENKIDSIINVSLASEIPLVPLKAKK